MVAVLTNRSQRGCLAALLHLAVVGPAFAVVEPEAFPSGAEAFVADSACHCPFVAVPPGRAGLAADFAFHFPSEGAFAVAEEIAVDVACRPQPDRQIDAAVPSAVVRLLVDSAVLFPSGEASHFAAA